MIDNLLLLEAPLMERLADQLADLTPKVHVLAAADLEGVTEKSQVTPAVHLLYWRHRIAESGTSGKTARLEQTWLAIVATKNVKNLRSGTAVRVDAGLIAAHVAKALMGFMPAGGSKPVRLAEGPDAGFSGGYSYLPLAFVAELALINT